MGAEEDMRLSGVLKESLVLPLREYTYFLGIGVLVLINFATGNALFFWKGINTGTGLGYLLISAITAIFMFAIIGNYARGIYVGKKFSRWKSIKQGFYSFLLLFVYTLIFSSLSYFINQLSNSALLWMILAFIFSFLMPSYILEILNVFYLENGIFSIIDFFERVFTWRYVIATLIVLLTNIIIIKILLSNLSIFITTSWLGVALNSVLQSIVFAYINLFSITIYLKMFWG